MIYLTNLEYDNHFDQFDEMPVDLILTTLVSQITVAGRLEYDDHSGHLDELLFVGYNNHYDQFGKLLFVYLTYGIFSKMNNCC